jgi:hypothetical protein
MCGCLSEVAARLKVEAERQHYQMPYGMSSEFVVVVVFWI